MDYGENDAERKIDQLQKNIKSINERLSEVEIGTLAISNTLKKFFYLFLLAEIAEFIWFFLKK